MELKDQDKVTQICFTHIPVSNVHESAKWYEENLGFVAELVFDTHAILQPDLHLIKTEGAVVQNTVDGKAAPRAAYFCSNIEDLYHKIKNKNVRVENIVEQFGCGLTFEVYDPDGNRITIWQAQ